jgi:hypothetical protein
MTRLIGGFLHMETSRKTAGTKVKKTAKRNESSAVPENNVAPTHDEIARRAFELYLARGASQGQDADDWFRAEAELRSHGPDQRQA